MGGCHNLRPAASLTIISCKYENRRKLQHFTTYFTKHKQQGYPFHEISTVLFYQVCADNVKAKQSNAEYGRRHKPESPSNKLTFDHLILKVRVTCDVGYLCAKFGLPRPLYSRLMPDVRDRRQTDVRQHHRLMPPPYRGGGIIKGKGKGSELLDIAPLTMLDSGALQPRKWQLIGTGCIYYSNAAQASGCSEPALTDYWTHSMQPAGILRPQSTTLGLHPVIHVPNYMDHYSFTDP